MAKKDEASILDYLKSKFALGSSSKAIDLPSQRKPKSSKEKNTKAPTSDSHRWRRIIFFVSLFALGIALFMIPRLNPQDSFFLPTIFWLLAISAYFYAFSSSISTSVKEIFTALKKQRSLMLSLGLLMLLAFALRVWNLGSIPYVFSGDEAAQGFEALRVISREIRNPFATGWTGVPTMTFFAMSIPMRIFGQNAFALRLPAAFVGALTLPIVFFMVRRLATKEVAWLTTGLLAVYHFHIHYSRLTAAMILDPFFAAITLLFLHRALSKSRAFDWLMVGAMPGLALYFYTGARIVSVLVLGLIFYQLLMERRTFWKKHKKGFLIALGAFLVTAGPMLQLALRFPEIFNSRVNQVGIFQNGWLEQEVIITGKTTAALLMEQFTRALLAFNFFPDRTIWYGYKTPLLDPLFGSIFFLGLLVVSLRLILPKANKNNMYLAAWFWGAMILGGALTVNPPSTMRLVTLAVPACFFIAYMIWEFQKFIKRAFSKYPTWPLMAIAFIGFASISLNSYFRDFSPQHISGGPNAEFATMTSPVLQEHAQTKKIVFLGEPWMTWTFPTFPFLVPEADAISLAEPFTAPLPAVTLSDGQGIIFVLHPQRVGELEAIRAAYPTGRLEEIRSTSQWQTVSTLYIVEP